jgi:alginate O-acetyltransferase complex protein AlgI
VTFNSFEFANFFVVTYLLYLVLSHRYQNILLLAASYYFYGSWNYEFLSLLVLSTLIDYGCGLYLSRHEGQRGRRLALGISLTANLGLLGVFKYHDFFVASLEELLRPAGFDVKMMRLDLVLPVGISFYTFQTMSYAIDVYRRDLKACTNLLDFALFVSFFPQLVAGPIERAGDLLPQVQHPRRVTLALVRSGVWLIVFGLFKKTVIADNFAPIADATFASPAAVSGPYMLTGIVAFALQIYGDFSGYSDIARGIARLMGFDLMANFRMPYFASGPADFWRRWHVSLSQWLRDYLYIPLGGSRKGPARTYVNLLLTMTLGGLWHGASAHFVAWGVFHGLVLVFYRFTRGEQRLPRVLSIPVFFVITLAGWVLFRVNAIGDVPLVLGSLFGGRALEPGLPSLWAGMAVLLLPLILVDLAQEWRRDLFTVLSWPAPSRLAFCLLLLTYIGLCGVTTGHDFIYFQF